MKTFDMIKISSWRAKGIVSHDFFPVEQTANVMFYVELLELWKE